MFPFDLARDALREGMAGFVHICETPDGIVGNFTGALYPPPLEPPWDGRPTAYPASRSRVTSGRELIATLTDGAPAEIRLTATRADTREATAPTWSGVIPGTERRAGHPVRPLRQPGRGAVRL